MYMVNLSSTAWMVACPFGETTLICHQWQAVVSILKSRRSIDGWTGVQAKDRS